MMFGLKWRCDGSEGIKWYVRAIRAHGSFYGEVRFQSAEQNRRIATSVSGQLPPTECSRMAELGACLAGQPAPVEPGPHFAALFERLSPTDGGDVRLLLLYHQGDENVECEDILYVARTAYESVTGSEIPSVSLKLPDLGNGWDFDDAAEMRLRYPRLFAKFGEN